MPLRTLMSCLTLSPPIFSIFSSSEIGIGEQGQFLFLLLDLGGAALEVEAGGDFLVRLLDGVLHFDHVCFADHVKRWHGGFLCLFILLILQVAVF
jgi:hypothetical protein